MFCIPTVFKAYVKRLLKEGFTQKSLLKAGVRARAKPSPKMGMLGMLVDAFMDSREQDLLFVPASISYEKIVESRSYVRELVARKKKPSPLRGS